MTANTLSPTTTLTSSCALPSTSTPFPFPPLDSLHLPSTPFFGNLSDAIMENELNTSFLNDSFSSMSQDALPQFHTDYSPHSKEPFPLVSYFPPQLKSFALNDLFNESQSNKDSIISPSIPSTPTKLSSSSDEVESPIRKPYPSSKKLLTPFNIEVATLHAKIKNDLENSDSSTLSS